DLVQRVARITADEMAAVGVHWNFAPVVAVVQDTRWGRTYEGFAEDPELVSELAAAAVRGLQGDDLSAHESILACAKHFLGDGGTVFGSRSFRGKPGLDQGDTRVDLATLKHIHLPSFISSIGAGVGSIMVSYNSWNGARVTGIRELLTDLLKQELGFEGFLISDYSAISQVDPDFKIAIMKSINAGIDMAMEPNRYRLFISNLIELVEAGQVPMTRIDDAVIRILRVKLAMGLLDPQRRQLADRQLHNSFGSTAHREVARQAVRESLVLLKNSNNILPLVKNVKHIYVAGRGGDDIGMQCGGWTVEWQGQRGNVTTGGTTLLTAIRQTVSSNTTVTYTPDVTGAEGAELGIAVIGEDPYAEGVGDRADLGISTEDIQVVERLKAAGMPVVVILLSGRPLILGELLDKADAIIAAWLPGTEGQGVADVLFGDYSPTGRLSFTWPRYMSQIPINIGDADYDPLFPYGFGLTYE
ncbi:MAG: glycoside hydrolase family 3 domain protein, partial [Gammaproteobacteria bacterium]|nr:glycoside hydrolase family 3 domain protein [Gammaproteobacteria bacterium]